MCSSKYCFMLKSFPHHWHMNCLCPMWMLMWERSWYLYWKRSLQFCNGTRWRLLHKRRPELVKNALEETIFKSFWERSWNLYITGTQLILILAVRHALSAKNSMTEFSNKAICFTRSRLIILGPAVSHLVYYTNVWKSLIFIKVNLWKRHGGEF